MKFCLLRNKLINSFRATKWELLHAELKYPYFICNPLLVQFFHSVEEEKEDVLFTGYRTVIYKDCNSYSVSVSGRGTIY